MFHLCFVPSSSSSPTICAPSCPTCLLLPALLSGSSSWLPDLCPCKILPALMLLLPACLLRAYLTSALLLMPRVRVGLLSVMVTLLKSILAFRPVIVVFRNPGVVFLLPHTVVVPTAYIMLAVVAVVQSAYSACFSLLPLPYCALP
jgi:hypothetical protein